MHITVDGLGNPLRFFLTGGVENNITPVVAYNAHFHEDRHLVEYFIVQMKCYCRIFIRFEKLSHCYLGFGILRQPHLATPNCQQGLADDTNVSVLPTQPNPLPPQLRRQ